MILNREQIIAAADRAFVEIDCPEWGGKVRLRSLDAEQSLHYESVVAKRAKGDLKVNPISAVLAVSIVDEAGVPLFNDKDMHEIGKKHPGVLTRLMHAVGKLNKIEEDAAGNSEGTPAEG